MKKVLFVFCFLVIQEIEIKELGTFSEEMKKNFIWIFSCN